MNLTCFKISLTRFTSCARFFIVSAFISCSCLPTALAGEYDTLLNNIESDLSLLNSYLRAYMGTDTASFTTGSFPGQITESVQNQEAYLEALDNYIHGRSIGTITYTRKGTLPYFLDAILFSLCGQDLPTSVSKSLPDHIADVKTKQDSANVLLQSILDKLVAVTNSMVASSGVGGTNLINIVPTNIVNITVNAQDVLAGNPWWNTNSAFAIWWDDFGSHVPSPSSLHGFSFAELVSYWSAFFAGSYTPKPFQNSGSYWGSDGENLGEFGSYTWFDAVADAFVSNQLADATYNARLLSALRGVSNAVDDSAAYVVNHLDYGMEDITNLLGKVVTALVEAHGDNPWWWTNSAFATDWDEWSLFGYPDNSVPRPYTEEYHTFPEVISQWLSARQNYIIQPGEHLWDSLEPMFGIGGMNERKNLFTWEDWLATWLRSNMTASSYAVLTSRVASAYAGTDVEDMPSTNSVLAEYEEALETPDTSDIEESFSDTMDVAENQLQSISNQFGRHGSPEIVVIPEFTVGGIHVREYRGSLDTSLTRVAHAVCVFLYTVFFIVATMHLIKVEWAFWTSLGTPVE